MGGLNPPRPCGTVAAKKEQAKGMPVCIRYAPLGDTAPGFAFDTPDGCTLVFDVDLSRREQVMLAAELLEEDEFAEVYPTELSA